MLSPPASLAARHPRLEIELKSSDREVDLAAVRGEATRDAVEREESLVLAPRTRLLDGGHDDMGASSKHDSRHGLRHHLPRQALPHRSMTTVEVSYTEDRTVPVAGGTQP